MKRFKKGPSPAMIVAMVALVVAMGGSAYAATKIGTNQIKNGAVTSKKTDRMWALVAPDGTIVQQSGGISMTSHPFTGGYYVNFPRSISGRSLVGTASNALGVIVNASVCGGTTSSSITCFAPGSNDNRHAYVNTADDAGSLSNERFYIQAW